MPFVSMVTGLFLSYQLCQFGSVYSLVVVFICVFLSLFVRSRFVFCICICAFFFLCGFTSLKSLLSPPGSVSSLRLKASSTPVIIEGVIDRRPDITSDDSRLVVRVDQIVSEKKSENVSDKILLIVSQGEVPFLRGDRIRFRTELKIPQRLGLPGEFDYHRYLALKGISITGRVLSHKEILLVRAAAENSFQRQIDIIARKLGERIRQAVPDKNISAVLAAVVLGDQKRISGNLNEAYTKAGVNHILSVSGFHAGIIATFISLILLQICTRFEILMLVGNVRKSTVLLTIPAMLLYLLLTGAAAATTRAVIMLIACAIALYVERETDTINILLAAAFMMLAIDPAALFDVSFQLSFLSLWGIIIFVPFITDRYCSDLTGWTLVLAKLLAASVAASAVTMIPVLYTFKVASFNGVISNFVIVPLLGYGAVISGFIVLPFISFDPLISEVLLWPSAKIVWLSNWIINYFSELPVIRFASISSLDMFLFLLFMISVTFVNNRLKRAGLCVLIPVLALTVHFTESPSALNMLRITMLSVGQSESLLLTLPDGTNMLVDGGGYLHETGRDFGQRILLPALASLGVQSIDRMILTHDHPDHYGGLGFVARNLSVGEFWTTIQASKGVGFAQIRSNLEGNNVPIKIINSGEKMELPGGVSLAVLYPPDRTVEDVADNVDRNEDSLVFRISYGKFSAIFTADAGFESEYAMIRSGVLCKSTVLKVAHHGSKYSTSKEFVNIVQPEIALISVGASNRFGLPSERTLGLLRSKGIKIFRTDIDGTIELTTDGSTYEVMTRFRPL